nr:dynein light chain [Hymenolepis microstoma]
MNPFCEKNDTNVGNDSRDGFVKYSDPIKLTKTYELINEGKVSMCDLPPDFCKMMAFSSIDEKTQQILYEEFPVRITKTGDDMYASFVRETQSSPLELIALINDIKMSLVQRAAKDSPLCNIREEILFALCSELLRQLIIECPERGMLFKQVLEEHYKYFEAYKVLLKHNEAFLCRKNLQAAYTKSFQLAKTQIDAFSHKVQTLEEDIEILKQKVKALQDSAEKMKKKFQEEKSADENRRQNELRYEHQLTEQLKVR